MEKALIIDIQNTLEDNFPDGDRTSYLNQILDENKPAYIALTCYQRDQWRYLEEEIFKVAARDGSGLLLEGLIHTCMLRNHTIRDPHHQSICTSWFQKPASYKQQFDEITAGFEFLEKAMGIKPIGYVPPQHLHNKNTIEAVRSHGMSFIITKAMSSNMHPYVENNVIIMPSESAEHNRTDSPAVHFYYDRIQEKENLFSQVLQNAVPLESIPIKSKTLSHRLNNTYIKMTKQLRDAKRLVEWLYDSKVQYQEDAITLRNQRRDEYEKHREELFG